MFTIHFLLLYSQDGSTPFSAACRRGHLAVAQWLVSTGVCVDIGKKLHADSPFRVACSSGKLEIAQFLLSIGVDKDEADEVI